MTKSTRPKPAKGRPTTSRQTFSLPPEIVARLEARLGAVRQEEAIKNGKATSTASDLVSAALDKYLPRA